LSFVPSIRSFELSGCRSGADDAGDANLDQVLTVAALAAGILAAALLEGDDLRAAGMLDQLGNDLGAGYERRPDLGAVAADHQDLGELDLRAGVASNFLDGDDVVGSDAVLLAARLYDSVHGYSFSIFRALWRRRNICGLYEIACISGEQA